MNERNETRDARQASSKIAGTYSDGGRDGLHCMARRLAFVSLFACVLSSSGALAASVVTDQNGRQVQIPEKVSRVATLVIPAASVTIALDQGPGRLIGINSASRQEIVGGMLGRLFPETKKIRADMAGEGFAPNVEALLSTRPDLVVQWGDRGSAIVDPIVRVGLPVLTLHSGGGGELAAEWLRILGQGLTGREARGRAFAERFLAVRAEIAGTVSSIPETRRPKVVYLYRAQGNAFQVAGNKTTVDSDIRLTGGINPASHLPGYAPVSIEQILAWAPDVVLLSNFEKAFRPATLFDNPLFASLPAVKGKRVYVYPQGGFRWDPPSQETPLAWRWLLTLFHPEIASPSLRVEMTESYQRLYAHAPTATELDIVLRMIDNINSLHYREKFGQ